MSSHTVHLSNLLWQALEFFLSSFIQSLGEVKLNERCVATVKNKNLPGPKKPLASVSLSFSIPFYCRTSPSWASAAVSFVAPAEKWKAIQSSHFPLIVLKAPLMLLMFTSKILRYKETDSESTMWSQDGITISLSSLALPALSFPTGPSCSMSAFSPLYLYFHLLFQSSSPSPYLGFSFSHIMGWDLKGCGCLWYNCANINLLLEWL